jgi:hypothetical protein
MFVESILNVRRKCIFLNEVVAVAIASYMRSKDSTLTSNLSNLTPIVNETTSLVTCQKSEERMSKSWDQGRGDEKLIVRSAPT